MYWPTVSKVTYPHLVKHPDAPPFVEMLEVVIVTSSCTGLFLLLLNVLFIIYVMVMVVMVLEYYEW
jgi:hypothetical protein